MYKVGDVLERLIANWGMYGVDMGRRPLDSEPNSNLEVVVRPHDKGSFEHDACSGQGPLAHSLLVQKLQQSPRMH